jgi:predicted porin
LENFEMKKTLVAVAALAAVFGAQAQATISGVMDAALTTSNNATTLGGGAFNQTEIFFNAAEDLGNGLKADISVNITNNAPQAATSALSSYNSYLGLSGDFGGVKLGNYLSPFFLATTIADGTGRGNGGIDIISGAGLNQLTVPQSIIYTSPSISGVSLSYLTTMATGAGTTSYALNYSTGGLKAAYASTTKSSKTDTLLAASYDFGVATAHYGYGTAESSATNQKVNTIGVTVPFGAMSVHYGMQKGEDTTVAKTLLSYAMSKRTTAYVLYSDDGTTAATATTTIVGLKHAF